MSGEKQSPFDRASIEAAFERMGELARAEGKVVEISVYGGSALILTLNHRPATRDVDAVFERDRTFVRKAVARIASEFGWQENWLNDGVKDFLSRMDGDTGAKSLFRTFPSGGQAGLRVFVASPGYLFAMKCLAMRFAGSESQDRDDIMRLARELSISSFEDAVSIVARYYPADELPPKTRLGLEEMFGPGTACGGPASVL